MKKITIKTTGLSLLELLEKYDTGSKGFYKHNTWWKDRDFAKEKPKAGEYEIVVEKQLENLTFSEQTKKLEKGWEVLHPAILAEAILTHFEETGERVLENWWSRTSSITSGGDRVYVGYFDAKGLSVSGWYHDSRHGSIGVASARKLSNLDSRPLESFDSSNLPKRSKYWDTMVNILEAQFPKGECQERGRAIIMLSYNEMMLTGTKFDDNGEPIITKLDD